MAPTVLKVPAPFLLKGPLLLQRRIVSGLTMGAVKG
jgi:ABC-type maltose transport system permease subunit